MTRKILTQFDTVDYTLSPKSKQFYFEDKEI